MLPGIVRGSGEIEAPLVRWDSIMRHCFVVQNADALRRRCMKEVLLLRQGDRRGEGEDYYDVISIQAGKQARDAGSRRGRDGQSIRSLVPDKAQDYRCLYGEKNG